MPPWLSIPNLRQIFCPKPITLRSSTFSTAGWLCLIVSLTLCRRHHLADFIVRSGLEQFGSLSCSFLSSIMQSSGRLCEAQVTRLCRTEVPNVMTVQGHVMTTCGRYWGAKEWTEAMGGKVWLESELNKGSTFLVAVPTKVTR